MILNLKPPNYDRTHVCCFEPPSLWWLPQELTHSTSHMSLLNFRSCFLKQCNLQECDMVVWNGRLEGRIGRAPSQVQGCGRGRWESQEDNPEEEESSSLKDGGSHPNLEIIKRKHITLKELKKDSEWGREVVVGGKGGVRSEARSNPAL